MSCTICFNKDAKYQCGHCGIFKYCSSKCQQKDWLKEHKTYCHQVHNVIKIMNELIGPVLGEKRKGGEDNDNNDEVMEEKEETKEEQEEKRLKIEILENSLEGLSVYVLLNIVSFLDFKDIINVRASNKLLNKKLKGVSEQKWENIILQLDPETHERLLQNGIQSQTGIIKQEKDGSNVPWFESYKANFRKFWFKKNLKILNLDDSKIPIDFKELTSVVEFSDSIMKYSKLNVFTESDILGFIDNILSLRKYIEMSREKKISVMNLLTFLFELNTYERIISISKMSIKGWLDKLEDFAFFWGYFMPFKIVRGFLKDIDLLKEGIIPDLKFINQIIGSINPVIFRNWVLKGRNENNILKERKRYSARLRAAASDIFRKILFFGDDYAWLLPAIIPVLNDKTMKTMIRYCFLLKSEIINGEYALPMGVPRKDKIISLLIEKTRFHWATLDISNTIIKGLVDYSYMITPDTFEKMLYNLNSKYIWRFSYQLFDSYREDYMLVLINWLSVVLPDQFKDFLVQKYEGKDRFSPLWFAINTRKYRVARVLIEKGIDVNFQNKYKKTALIFACEVGGIESVRLIVESGKLKDINHKNVYGNTALMTSVDEQEEEIINYLLKKGADILTTNVDGDTLLMTSSLVSISKTILDNIPESKREEYINKQNVSGDTALIIAAREDNEEMVEYLIENGANASIKNKSGESMLTLKELKKFI